MVELANGYVNMVGKLFEAPLPIAGAAKLKKNPYVEDNLPTGFIWLSQLIFHIVPIGLRYPAGVLDCLA